MALLVRLKVGFFEVKPYQLKAKDAYLYLIPREPGGEVISLPERSISSVTLSSGRNPQIEIQARDQLYSGTLGEDTALAEVVKYLSERLNIQITCEYQGGDLHVKKS